MQDYNFNEYFDRFPLAMAYVPWQHLTQIYEDLDKAYCTGTIFPELTKPFTGRSQPLLSGSGHQYKKNRAAYGGYREDGYGCIQPHHGR